MTPEKEQRESTSQNAPSDLTSEELTDKQKSDLANEDTQEAYRRAYLAQLRARDCPGCGEGGIF